MLCEGNLFSGFLQEVMVWSQYFENNIMIAGSLENPLSLMSTIILLYMGVATKPALLDLWGCLDQFAVFVAFF